MTISDETPSVDPRGVKEHGSSAPAQAVALGMENVISDIYGAVYSGVPVFEMMCRNVVRKWLVTLKIRASEPCVFKAVMRRQADSYLNATQILKVAGIDKGRRTKILEKEIINGEHEKVQGGYGKYQGTWYVLYSCVIFHDGANEYTLRFHRIPFERGIQLAVQFQVEHYLAPILNFVPPSPGKGEFMPSKEQILAAATSRETSRANTTGQGRRKSSVGDNRSPDVTRKQRKKSIVGLPSALSQEARLDDQHLENSWVEEPATKKARFVEGPDSVSDVVPRASLGERHRAPLMAMFLSDNPLSIPEILLQSQSPADLNVNIVL